MPQRPCRLVSIVQFTSSQNKEFCTDICTVYFYVQPWIAVTYRTIFIPCCLGFWSDCESVTSSLINIRISMQNLQIMGSNFGYKLWTENNKLNVVKNALNSSGNQEAYLAFYMKCTAYYCCVNKTLEHLFSYCKLARSGKKPFWVRHLIYFGQW